ncbi:hypothetical protein BLAT2472_20141 [Burkholderia latens]
MGRMRARRLGSPHAIRTAAGCLLPAVCLGAETLPPVPPESQPIDKRILASSHILYNIK